MSDQLVGNSERRQNAVKVFSEHPDKICLPIQEKILAQQVVLGMTPYDAQLAAGDFFFKVQADPAMWPSNSDPHTVMWAQSLHPDNSKICMTFQNDTQYPEEGIIRFQVVFENGKAVEINKQNITGDL